MKKQVNRRQWIGTVGMLSLGGTLASGIPSSASTNLTVLKNGREFQTEILVCGGGPAGFAAATNAARLGRKVLLLERYGRLGGMGVHARVFPLLGRANSPFLKEVHKRTGSYSFDPERLDLHYADMLQEAGASFLLHSWAVEPILDGTKITGVKAISKEGTMTIRADLVVDASGDGDIAAAAGAPFEMGRKGDNLVQPMSIMFAVGGVASNAQYCGSEQESRIRKIGDETWEQVTVRALKNGELPENVGIVRTHKMQRPGEASVNATQVNRLFGTKVEDLTKAEIECRRQAFQVVEFMRKYLPGYENAYLQNMPAAIGVRETRRIVGLDRLEREDLLSGRKWDNAVVRDAAFAIDIHNPDGSGQAENQTGQHTQGTAVQVKPYDIPLTCMIPKGVDGLLVAGRCMSGSHDAHASYRVQNICLAMGTGVGAAAAMAVCDKVAPKDVDIEKVQKYLFG